MNFKLDDLKEFMITNNKIDTINIVNTRETTNTNINTNDNLNSGNGINTRILSKKENIANKFSNIDTLFYNFMLFIKPSIELTYSYLDEKNLKIEFIEKLRTIKKKLKTYKIKLEEIENELLCCKFIGINTILSLCILSEINLMISYKWKYYELLFDNDETETETEKTECQEVNLKNYLFIVKESNRFKIQDTSETIIKEKIIKIKKTYLKLDYLNQQLKSVNSYSKPELLLLCSKLSIKQSEEKISKKELYEKILEKYYHD